MRGFDPGAVKSEHIKKVTFLYGKDKPGIDLRLDRFEEILRGEGHDVRVYSSLDSAALGYLLAGDMFSDEMYVSVHDLSPAFGSSTEAKKAYKSLTGAVSSYGEDSRFLFACPTDKLTKAAQAFMGFAREQGGVAREVKAPSNYEMEQWIAEYLKSTGRAFPSSSVKIVAEVAGNDVDIARTILDNIGEEVASMSNADLVEWLAIDQKTPLRNIYEAICEGDIVKIAEYRRTFPDNASGLRQFLVKMRFIAFDLMLLSACPPKDLKPYNDYKTARYGAYVDGWKFLRLVELTGGYERFSAIYAYANEAVESVSGAGSKKGFSFSEYLANIVK